MTTPHQRKLQQEDKGAGGGGGESAKGSDAKAEPKDALGQGAGGGEKKELDALSQAKAGEKKEANVENVEKKGEEKKEAPKLELKVPDGVKVDEKHLESLRAFAEKNGLDQAKAQGALDLYLSIEKGRLEAGELEIQAQSKKWADELQKDKELGGANWPDTVKSVNRAIVHFKADGLVETLRAVGLGNNPGVVRLFAAAGRSLKEDSVQGSGSTKGTGGVKPLGDVLYGDGPMKTTK